jgi:hypothetical protein
VDAGVGCKGDEGDDVYEAVKYVGVAQSRGSISCLDLTSLDVVDETYKSCSWRIGALVTSQTCSQLTYVSETGVLQRNVFVHVVASTILHD